jgi:hypothetical protein
LVARDARRIRQGRARSAGHVGHRGSFLFQQCIDLRAQARDLILEVVRLHVCFMSDIHGLALFILRRCRSMRHIVKSVTWGLDAAVQTGRDHTVSRAVMPLPLRPGDSSHRFMMLIPGDQAEDGRFHTPRRI